MEVVPSIASTALEDYDSSIWRNKARVLLQAKLVEAMIPTELEGDRRDRWAIVWLQRYAVPFARWLDDVPGRSRRIAKRLHQGPAFSKEELRVLALKLENQ
jgi:hypothetical protein